METYENLAELDLHPDILALSINASGDVQHYNRAFSQLFAADKHHSPFKDTLEDQQFNQLIHQLENTFRSGHYLFHTELRHQLSTSEIINVKWQFFVMKKGASLLFTAIGYVMHPDLYNEGIPERVMDYITDGFFVLDQHGDFLNVNQGFADLLSLGKSKILALNASQVFGDKDSALYSREVSRYLYEARMSKFEAYFSNTDQWWFFVIYPLDGRLHVYAKNISQRKQYETSLKQSQSKLKAILNSTSESNLLLNQDIRILSYNRAAELMAKKILGVSLKEDMSFLELLPEPHRDRFKEKFQKALEGHTIKYEREVRGADDISYWFRLTFFPVFDEDELIIGVAFNAENIQERKEAEEKLNMYALIASHITDAVIITDAQGLTTWVNESFIRKTGYTLDDMYGLAPGAVLQGPETDPLGKQEMHDAVLEGRPFHVELINYTKAGKPFHVEIKADPYYRSDGKLLGFIAIQPDITHRKIEEDKRIRESWDRFHAIFEHSINAILLADDKGCFVDANPAACQISGYTLEEIRKLQLMDLMDNESGLTKADDWETFMLKGKMEGTVAIKTREGELKIMDFRAVADILPGLHMSILSDITSHYLAEKKILEQNEHLNRLNDDKNQLFSIIAHDLRSPLNSLQGMIKLLQVQAIDQAAFNKHLGLIEDRIQHSLNLMDNLFQWAQYQLKGIQLQEDAFDLHLLGQNKLSLFQEMAEEKGITIVNEIPPDSLVKADINMTDLIIRNLVANAIKFCSAGDQISIQAQRQHGQMLVCVKDTGTGIQKEHLPEIFGGRMSTPGTKKEKGSGLGLRICKDFVEKQGGQIWVESEWKKGSRFCFTLPHA